MKTSRPPHVQAEPVSPRNKPATRVAAKSRATGKRVRRQRTMRARGRA